MGAGKTAKANCAANERTAPFTQINSISLRPKCAQLHFFNFPFIPLGFTFNQHFSFRLIDSITFINRRSRRKVWFHSFLIAFVGLVLGLLLFAEHWRVAPPITPQRQPIQTNQLQWNETIQTKTKVFLFIHSFPWALNGRQFSFLSSARPLGRASWKKKRNWMAQRSQPTHFFHSFNNWFH